MVATWESTAEEQSHEVSNLTLMAIGDESFDELDLPSCDELFMAFKELHDDLKKIGLKNASFKKEIFGIHK